MPERDRASEGLFRPLALAVLAGIGAVAGLVVAYQALPVLKIVAIAALLALVLRTIARGLERIGASPLLSALLLLAGIGAFGALLYLVVLPNVVQEIRVLTSGGPGSLDALARSIRDAPFVPAIDRLLERLEDRLQDLLGSLPQIVISAAVAITAAVSAVFLALYFAVDPDTYVRGILRLAPVERRAGVREFIGVLVGRLRGWVVGTALVARFVGVSAGVGLWLLGVPLALTFGLLAGFLDIILLFGSVVGGALPAAKIEARLDPVLLEIEQRIEDLRANQD